jgi:nucleoside-diphosphate-sugar epimerase
MVVRVFVAGGTGVIGRRLVPQLVARGHQVRATTSAAKLGLLEQLGAEGVLASNFPRLVSIDVTLERHEVNGQPGANRMG